LKIVILGAGRVGASVAENLVSERNDITVIDTDIDSLTALGERLDLRTLVGNGTHPAVLRAANIEDADMLIAAAAMDETNLVACRIAKQQFNVPLRIARVRSQEFVNHPEVTGDGGFCIDHVICPEQSVTQAMVLLVEHPEALQVIEFAEGKLSLVAVRADGGPLVGRPIEDMRKHIPNVDARIVAIFRNERSVIPEGKTLIEAGDEVFCLAATRNIRKVLSELRPMGRPVRNIMIAGGGNIGLRLAQSLGKNYHVKIIDPNKKRCEYLAGELPSALVLYGDATDGDLLGNEQIQDIDLFVALTSDDEDNIMSTLLAKRMGARRVIALINRKAYADLVQGGHIDIAIAPEQATLSELLAYVRRGDVVAVHSLRRGAAEAIEAIAHGDAKSSRVIGKKIEDIDLLSGKTPGVVIGAIVRGQSEAATVLMAHHDTVVEPEDHVIVFVANKKMLSKVEKLFQVSAGFF
jgi:trk system potassium uptake protein TrkA